MIDFIDFQWFPIFNVADMAIDIGGALFVLWTVVRAPSDAASGMIHEEIPPALAGERLDRIVALITDASRSDAAALVAAGGVAGRRRGHASSGKLRLQLGQHIDVDETKLPTTEATRRRSDGRSSRSSTTTST